MFVMFVICSSLEMSVLASVAVDMRWLTAGAAFSISSSANYPVKFEISADLNTEQTVVKVFPPKTVKYSSFNAGLM